MIKTCSKCKSENPEYADFCRKCGLKFQTLEENINNLLIQHDIEKEYESGVIIRNFNWYMKFNSIYLNFDVFLVGGELNTNIGINTVILKNNGTIIKRYKDVIFKTDENNIYTYEKPISSIEEFNNIKNVIVFPGELDLKK